jgi:hypothetical protein
MGSSILKPTQRGFHERVHLIKKQLVQAKHPLHALIHVFKRKFYKENMCLLQKTTEEGGGIDE